MDSQNTNTQNTVENVAAPVAPQPVVCRVCMHVNPAGTPVCQMCANDLDSDAEFVKMLEREAEEARLRKEAEAIAAAEAAKAAAAEEARRAAEAEALARAEAEKAAQEAAAEVAEPAYEAPVFEDDEGPVISKKAQKLLEKLDVEIARYRMKVDAFEAAKEKERKTARVAKIDRKIQNLTKNVNKVIAVYRKKLLREKFELPLYDWENTANA